VRAVISERRLCVGGFGVHYDALLRWQRGTHPTPDTLHYSDGPRHHKRHVCNWDGTGKDLRHLLGVLDASETKAHATAHRFRTEESEVGSVQSLCAIKSL
jgi:hypothetical protein